MAGKFEVYTDAGGKFRFHLEAGNGEVIASSETYSSKESARAGVQSAKTNAPDTTVDDQT